MKTSLKKGTFYLTIASFIFILTGYFINIWLGRFLGPVDYGNYGIIISLVSLINIIQTSGFTQSAAKYIAEDESASDAIFKSALTIQLVATVIVTVLFFILARPLSLLLNDLSLVPYIQLASFIFPIYGIYALLIDYYNGLHHFKKQAIMNSIYSLTKAFGVIILAYFFHLKGILVGFILAPITAILIGFYYPKSVKSHFPYKKLLLFSFPLIGYIVFSTLLQSIDLYFVKSILGEKAPGYYTASQNISRLIYFGTLAISSVILPSISHSVSQKLNEKTRSTITMALRTALLLIIPSIAIISGTSKQILTLIYSHAYIAASDVLSILVLSVGFFTVFTLLCTILNAAGTPKFSLLLSLLGVIINALLCFILIPLFNIKGAAIASTTGNFIVMCAAAFFVYNRFHQLVFISSFLRIFFVSIIVYIFANIINVPILFLPLLYIFLFSMYVCLLTLMKELTKNDLDLVRSLLPEHIGRKIKI